VLFNSGGAIAGDGDFVFASGVLTVDSLVTADDEGNNAHVLYSNSAATPYDCTINGAAYQDNDIGLVATGGDDKLWKCDENGDLNQMAEFGLDTETRLTVVSGNTNVQALVVRAAAFNQTVSLIEAQGIQAVTGNQLVVYTVDAIGAVRGLGMMSITGNGDKEEAPWAISHSDDDNFYAHSFIGWDESDTPGTYHETGRVAFACDVDNVVGQQDCDIKFRVQSNAGKVTRLLMQTAGPSLFHADSSASAQGIAIEEANEGEYMQLNAPVMTVNETYTLREPNVLNVTAATFTVDPEDLRQGFFVANHVTAVDFTLPTAVLGYNACWTSTTTGLIILDAAAGDRIIYAEAPNGAINGTAEAIDSPPMIGASICLTAIDATTWMAHGMVGTWVPGGDN
jgi:hypothetical protein